MRLIRRRTDLPDDARGAAVAMGNFDGVHRGHRAVVGRAVEAARRLGAPAGVLTFEPHPRALFRPDDPPFRLTLLPAKAREIAALGCDVLYALEFDRAFSELPAAAFVDEVLVRSLGVRHVVVGHDFVFGHGRGGTADTLRALGAARGFGVEVVEPVGEGGVLFSSSAVRELLRAGRPDEAAAVLGRPWEVEGAVAHGDKRGRLLGFPTANVPLGDHLRPLFGVYAVRAALAGDGPPAWRPGVANLGRRPTVGGTEERLEVHLFDVDEDLYGRTLRVRLEGFVRPERRFDGLDALKARIAEDAAVARDLLGA
jgi:riboflavin kinase/FMN adenylyltransferase